MSSNESIPNIPQPDWLADLLVPEPSETKDADPSPFAAAASASKPAASEVLPPSPPLFHAAADQVPPVVSPAAQGLPVAQPAPAGRLPEPSSGSAFGRMLRRGGLPFLLGTAAMFAGEASVRHFGYPSGLRFGGASEVSKTEQPSAAPASNAIVGRPATGSSALQTESPPAFGTPAQAGPSPGSAPTGPVATAYPTVEDLLPYFRKPAARLSAPPAAP